MSKDKEIEVKVTSSEDEQKAGTEQQNQSDAAVNRDGTEEVDADATGDQPTEEPEETLSEEDKLRARVEELEDQLLRAAADFENYRKRAARQYDDGRRAATEKILGDLLEVVDNFDRALSHSGDAADLESFRKGTELIYVQLTTLLAKHDVTPIDALGEPFDPNLHEALMQVESDDYPEGVVALELGKGYRLGDRVLRHSKVGVSRGTSEGDNDAK